jgi:hypothetical protein
MGSHFHIKREKWGRFTAGPELKARVEAVFGPYLKRAGLVLVRFAMQNSPVVSGHLRRGWALGEIEWHGSIVKIRVGNAVIYAKRVNDSSRKSKGYVDRGFQDGRAQAEAILREGVKVLSRELWKAT